MGCLVRRSRLMPCAVSAHQRFEGGLLAAADEAFEQLAVGHGRALAQTAGTAIMRLANADLLPFEFGNFSDTMQTYVKELKSLAQKSRDEIIERNRELEEGVFTAMTDPRVRSVPPAKEAVPPYLNFAPLDNATDALARASAEYRKALDRAAANGGATIAKASLAEVNLGLMESEHKLTLEQGLPGRPWFKHFVDAPGQYTGYEAKTLPVVREAIEQKQWKEAEAGIAITAQVLETEAALFAAGRRAAVWPRGSGSGLEY